MNRFAGRRNRKIVIQLFRKVGSTGSPAARTISTYPMRGITMKTIHPKITEVLTGTFKVPAHEVLPESTMDSLEMDSLAVAEFAVIIKETLGVDADSEKLYKDATLAEISAYIDEAVGSAAAEATVPVSNTR